jgi:hypothetical protein
MHCWHQKVTVEPAHAGDRYADVFVDRARRPAQRQERAAADYCFGRGTC